MNRRKKSTKWIMGLIVLIIANFLYIPGILAKQKDSVNTSQETPENHLKITFDYQTGDLTPKYRKKYVVSVGSHVTLSVININQFKYNVIINGSLVNHNTEIPNFYKNLGKESPEEKKPVDKSPAGASPGAALDLETVLAQQDGLKKVPNILFNHSVDLKKIQNFITQLESILHNAETFSTLEFQKKQLIAIFLDTNKNIDSITNQMLIQIAGEQFKEAEKAYFYVYKYLAKEGITPPDELKKELEKLSTLIEEFKKNSHLNKLYRLLNSFSKDHFSVSLTVPTVDADEVQFEVEIKPVIEGSVKVHHHLGKPLIVKVKGGWKLDFSSGVLFHLNAQNRNYWTEEIQNDDANVTLKRKSEKSALTPIVGALLHIYPRRAKIFGKIHWSGFCFGLGNGEADKLTYHLGTGLVLGEKNRFLINLGFSFVSIDTLLPKYKDAFEELTDESGGIIIKKPADGVSLVDSDYKLRFFFSISYNF